MGCGASRNSAPAVAPAGNDAAHNAPAKQPLPDPPNRPRTQHSSPPPPAEPEGPPPKDNASRGVSYDVHIDHKVHRLYAGLGERLLWAVCYKFYSLVESDTEQPDFAEVFSTPAARASELLCWYLMEAWGGPSLYSKARGSHFSFLYSVHSIWRFNLTDKYWQRWIHHFLAAAEHYCVLLEQAASAAQQAGAEGTKPPPLVLPKMSARYAELRKQMSLPPMEDELTLPDEQCDPAKTGAAGGSACPFAKLAPPGAPLPLGHQPTHTPASVEDQYRVPEVTLVDAKEVGVITRDDLVTMRYYLSRLREWLDVPLQTELDKNKYVAVFD